jgi:hypothetical protein
MVQGNNLASSARSPAIAQESSSSSEKDAFIAGVTPSLMPRTSNWITNRISRLENIQDPTLMKDVVPPSVPDALWKRHGRG